MHQNPSTQQIGVKCYLVPHHVDEMPQIGPITAQCKLLGPTCPAGQAASHLVFLSKQIRTRFLSTNQFNHPPPASTGPAKKASKVVHICFSLDLLGEKDVRPKFCALHCLSSGLMSSFSHQCDCRVLSICSKCACVI